MMDPVLGNFFTTCADDANHIILGEGFNITDLFFKILITVSNNQAVSILL